MDHIDLLRRVSPSLDIPVTSHFLRLVPQTVWYFIRWITTYQNYFQQFHIISIIVSVLIFHPLFTCMSMFSIHMHTPPWPPFLHGKNAHFSLDTTFCQSFTIMPHLWSWITVKSLASPQNLFFFQARPCAITDAWQSHRLILLLPWAPVLGKQMLVNVSLLLRVCISVDSYFQLTHLVICANFCCTWCCTFFILWPCGDGKVSLFCLSKIIGTGCLPNGFITLRGNTNMVFTNLRHLCVIIRTDCSKTLFNVVQKN